MVAQLEILGRLSQRADDIAMGDGREVFRDIIARSTVAAQRAGDDHQIADLDFFLQRAATPHTDQRLSPSGAKNFRSDRRIRRETPAVTDRYALAFEVARVHLVVEKGEILLRLVEQ